METALVAAVIAALAAVVAAAVGWFAAAQARRATDRGHAWARIVWASDHRRSTSEIPDAVLRRLIDVRWAGRDDRDLAEDVLAFRSRHVDGVPDVDEQDLT